VEPGGVEQSVEETKIEAKRGKAETKADLKAANIGNKKKAAAMSVPVPALVVPLKGAALKKANLKK
jgi:hypothetical protein